MEAKERMLRFVEKMGRKEPVTEVEVKMFIIDLVKNNPYLQHSNPPAIQFAKRSPEGEMAKYSKIQGITVTNEFVADVVSGKMGLTDILNTVGHEYRHFIQSTEMEEIKTKDKNLKEYCQDITRAWQVESLTKSEVDEIIQTLAICTDNEYFKKLQAKSPEEKKEIIKNIAFADYLHAKHEQDARLGGIAYSAVMLEGFSKDFAGNENMEQFISSQEQDMYRHINNYHQDKKKYTYIEEFEKQLQNITINVLRDLEDKYKIILSNNINAEFSGCDDKELQQMNEYGNFKLALLNRTVDYFCENKSLEELSLIYKSELNRGSGYICAAIDDFVFNKSKFSEKDKQSFQNSVFEMIMKDNYKNKIFTPSYLFTSALNEKQLQDVIRKYVKEKDLYKLSKISSSIFHFSNNFQKDSKTIMFNFDNIMPVIQQINYKLEKGQTVSKEDYENCRNILNELKREFDYIKSSDNKHVQNMINEINRISQSLELYSDIYLNQTTNLDSSQLEDEELDNLLNDFLNEGNKNTQNTNSNESVEIEL